MTQHASLTRMAEGDAQAMRSEILNLDWSFVEQP